MTRKEDVKRAEEKAKRAVDKAKSSKEKTLTRKRKASVLEDSAGPLKEKADETAVTGPLQEKESGGEGSPGATENAGKECEVSPGAVTEQEAKEDLLEVTTMECTASVNKRKWARWKGY